MTDSESEIVDFYPEDFDLDLNGKKQSWKAVVLLPFIDEKRLLSAMSTKYPLLTAEEHARNEMGKDALFVSDRHPLYDIIATEFYSKKNAKKDGECQKIIKLPIRTGGLAGTAEKNPSYLPHMSLLGPEEEIKLEPEVDDDRSMSVLFTMPTSKHVHKSMLLRGVKEPTKQLDHTDIAILKSKARNSGRSYGGAPLMGERNGSYGNGGGGGRGGRVSYRLRDTMTSRGEEAMLIGRTLLRRFWIRHSSLLRLLARMEECLHRPCRSHMDVDRQVLG